MAISIAKREHYAAVYPLKVRKIEALAPYGLAVEAHST